MIRGGACGEVEGKEGKPGVRYIARSYMTLHFSPFIHSPPFIRSSPSSISSTHHVHTPHSIYSIHTHIHTCTLLPYSPFLFILTPIPPHSTTLTFYLLVSQTSNLPSSSLLSYTRPPRRPSPPSPFPSLSGIHICLASSCFFLSICPLLSCPPAVSSFPYR